MAQIATYMILQIALKLGGLERASTNKMGKSDNHLNVGISGGLCKRCKPFLYFFYFVLSEILSLILS